MLPASPAPTAPRQLSIVFESLALEGMSPGQRANAVTQLAMLLLQAAGVQTQGANNASNDLLPAAVLRRKAVIYVRQSTQTQVQTNLESQRRQYDLVEEARRRGFAQVEVIDDDLGRSASGMVARPGFDRLWPGCVPVRLAL